MNLALFDFDGTITVNDTFSEFLRVAVTPARVVAAMGALAPVGLAYRCQWISASRARPMVARFVFQGRRAALVRELGTRYASDYLPKVVRRRALERIAWHKREGDLVVVVSASLDVYLAPWCDALGVRRVCTELEERNGRLTGKYRFADCSGGEKVRRILAEYEPSRYPVIYAYGDTLEDREMLGIAHRKYYRSKRNRGLERSRLVGELR
jgi:phosphatidylglycerophosphatase C